MSVFRLSGIAETVDTRDGIAKASKEPYSIPYVNVRVDRFVTTSCNVPDGLYDAVKALTGQHVDLVVDVTASGGYLRAQVLDFWPEELAAGGGLHSVSA